MPASRSDFLLFSFNCVYWKSDSNLAVLCISVTVSYSELLSHWLLLTCTKMLFFSLLTTAHSNTAKLLCTVGVNTNLQPAFQAYPLLSLFLPRSRSTKLWKATLKRNMIVRFARKSFIIDFLQGFYEIWKGTEQLWSRKCRKGQFKKGTNVCGRTVILGDIFTNWQLLFLLSLLSACNDMNYFTFIGQGI